MPPQPKPKPLKPATNWEQFMGVKAFAVAAKGVTARVVFLLESKL